MTLFNESDTDRSVRMLAGIVLLVGGRVLSSSTLGVGLLVIGTIALGTGIAGWCPAYSICGVSTAKTSADHCPKCDTEYHDV